MKNHAEKVGHLRALQALPLEQKIIESQNRIHEWYEAWNGKVYGAFSGGKDSTVMMDLIWGLYYDVPGVFINTGLEYPEIVRFVKDTAVLHNIEILRPKIPFQKVVEKYGYPAISKQQAGYIHEVRHAKSINANLITRLTGVHHSGGQKKWNKISNKWIPFCFPNMPRVSDKCCKVMKKDPQDRYAKESGRQPFVGVMTGESNRRELTYLQYGCNAFDTKRPRSWPLSFWTEDDIWNYIKSKNLPYSKIYDMGYTRTGCMFCMFGVHLEHRAQGYNRFTQMKKTHPKHWDYCINKLGCGKVLDMMGVPYDPADCSDLWGYKGDSARLHRGPGDLKGETDAR